jgi:putative oxygen-independent coproporphyrinogen III oxidase
VTDPFGVYVHVPFCRLRCDYCAFATYTDRDHLMSAYVAACRQEVRRAVEEEGMGPASSVFVGGGTPSRLPADLLASLLECIPRRTGAEVTVECNPEDVEQRRLTRYRAAGVTRVSLGAQSLVPRVLVDLGRRHGTAQVREAAATVADAGFASWNLDLIYGAAAERDADWESTLCAVLDLPHPPPHLSAYALTVEPGTPLRADPRRHPDDDVQAARYEHTDRVLSAAGYEWEEISNWARPGHGCAHNRLYWRQGDYRGIGSAAHSHRRGHRFWNVRTPDRYIGRVRAGRSPMAAEEWLDPGQRRFEALSLSLRTPAGVPAGALDDVGALAGLVVRQGDRVVLTRRGRLLANVVTGHLRTEGRGWPTGTMPGMSAPDAPPVELAPGRAAVGAAAPVGWGTGRRGGR